MSSGSVRWLDEHGAVARCALDDIECSAGAPWVWVDLVDADQEILSALEKRFSLHPLLVEDALHEQQRPKLDAFDDGIFLAWLTPVPLPGDGFDVAELDVFLGANHLITVRSATDAAAARVLGELSGSLAVGPDWMLHAIIDRLVDSVLPIVDDLGDEIDDIEDVLLGEPRPDDLRRLYSVRRRLVQLHRIVAPERDILRGLARERALVSQEAYRYFLDVGDHLARVEDSIETYRDVGAAAMDIYLSAQSNRMNEIMKQLTVVATIFMPLTLITGIYGMNTLAGMWPPVLARWSFTAIMVFMGVVAVWMTLFFRRKKWW